MQLDQSRWKVALNKLDQFVMVQSASGNGQEEAKSDEQVHKSNDELIKDNQSFVSWFETNKKEFRQFRIQLQQKSVKKRLKSLIQGFDGDRKQLKQMFDAL